MTFCKFCASHLNSCRSRFGVFYFPAMIQRSYNGNNSLCFNELCYLCTSSLCRRNFSWRQNILKCLETRFYILFFEVGKGDHSYERMALMTIQRARPGKNTVFQFDGESDKKQEKCFIVILYGNSTFFDKSSHSPKQHQERWAVLNAAFCCWSFLTKVRNILKWKVQVTYVIRYQSWDWSSAVLSATVHVTEFLCTQ